MLGPAPTPGRSDAAERPANPAPPPYGVLFPAQPGIRFVMALDLPAAPHQTPSTAAAKVRIRFRKGGDVRFLSHHDLMRTFERMLRRADLPFRRTQGFHPKPRLVFALSLPLGVVGLEEVVELELNDDVPPDAVRERLAAQAPPGLTILTVRPVEPRAGAQVCRLCYRVALPCDAANEVRRHATQILALAEWRVDRERSPARKIDLRPSLVDLRVTDTGGGAALEIDLRPMPAGTARPEEVLRVLGLEGLTESGAVIERCRLELTDENPPPPATPDVTDTGPGGHSAGSSPVAKGIA